MGRHFLFLLYEKRHRNQRRYFINNDLVYKKLLADENINFFFKIITNIGKYLEHHLDILCIFWEQALFLKGGYSNNMFQIHKAIHEKSPFKPEHYNIWLGHLYSTVDNYFTGNYAEQMKTQALNMATVLKIKLI